MIKCNKCKKEIEEPILENEKFCYKDQTGNLRISYCCIDCQMLLTNGEGQMENKLLDKEFCEDVIKSSSEIQNLLQQESVPVDALVIKPNGGLTEREKSLILWFMELAVKMKMKDYTEESIASIDLDAWYEDYYKENELPLNALEMDEREGL